MTDGPKGDRKRVPGLSSSERDALGETAYTEEEPDTGVREADLLSHNLTPEEIERRAAAGDHRRGERFRDAFENVVVGGLYTFAGLLLAVGLSWFWHLLTPGSLHWLSPDQLANLQNVVTAGLLAGVVSGHVRRRLWQR